MLSYKRYSTASEGAQHSSACCANNFSAQSTSGPLAVSLPNCSGANPSSRAKSEVDQGFCQGRLLTQTLPTSYIDQLNLILGILGTPEDETLQRIASERAGAYLRSLPFSKGVNLESLYPDADPLGKTASKLPIRTPTDLPASHRPAQANVNV